MGGREGMGERLERIIRESKGVVWNTETDEDLLTELDTPDFNWLIEQAERAETLEMKYENSGSMFNRQNMQARIDELEHQNQKYRKADEGEFLDNLIGRLYEYENKIIRYREALEFYANRGHYARRKSFRIGEDDVIFLKDDGVIAREALEGEGE